MRNTIIVDGKRKVCRIFDMGSNEIDRYTIAFKAQRINGILFYPYLASSVDPFHPQGFGQYGESNVFLTGRHLGKRVSFESLPDQVKQFILQSI